MEAVKRREADLRILKAIRLLVNVIANEIQFFVDRERDQSGVVADGDEGFRVFAANGWDDGLHPLTERLIQSS